MSSFHSNHQPESTCSERASQLVRELHRIGSLPAVLRCFREMTGWELSYCCSDSIPEGLRNLKLAQGVPISLLSNSTEKDWEFAPVENGEKKSSMVQEAAAVEDRWFPINLTSEFQKLKAVQEQILADQTGFESPFNDFAQENGKDLPLTASDHSLSAAEMTPSVQSAIKKDLEKLESLVNSSVFECSTNSPKSTDSSNSTHSPDLTDSSSLTDSPNLTDSPSLTAPKSSSAFSESSSSSLPADSEEDFQLKFRDEFTAKMDLKNVDSEILETLRQTLKMLSELGSCPIGFLHLSRPGTSKGTSPSYSFFCSSLSTKKKNLSFAPSLEPNISFEEAERMALSLADLIAEMQFARFRVWLSEMEMSASSPIQGKMGTYQKGEFAARFRGLMEFACKAFGFDAIGIYSCHSDLQVFRLRASVGLAMDSLMSSVRSFKEANADLRAYGHDCIIIQDVSTQAESFNMPEHFSSGLCMPLKTGNGKFGTIWFFSDQNYFPERTIMQAELFADHLANLIEHETLCRRYDGNVEYRSELKRASELQTVLTPIHVPWNASLDLAGWTKKIRRRENQLYFSPRNGDSQYKKAVCGDFYDWFPLPNHQMFVALGSMGTSGIAGAILAASVRTALRSHAIYGHPIAELLKHVNQTLWLQLAAESNISLFCGVISQENQYLAVNFAQIGTLKALQINSKGLCRSVPLTASSNSPLSAKANFESNFESNSAPNSESNSLSSSRFLGLSSDFHCFEDRIYLKENESLVVFNDGLSTALKSCKALAGSAETYESSEKDWDTESGLNSEKDWNAEYGWNVSSDWLSEKEPSGKEFTETKSAVEQAVLLKKMESMLGHEKHSSAQLLAMQVKSYFRKYVSGTKNDQSVLAIQHCPARRIQKKG